MHSKSNYPIRLLFYFGGFLIMTLGIAISVKSDLGVSPVSSIPYTMTCVWGIEMGFATILFHIGLVIIQILLLRKKFKLKNLLQVPVGIVFGYFTTFGNYLMSFLPDPGMPLRIVMMLLSSLMIATGIFLYVPADIMPLAGEGTMLALSQVTKIRFSTVKIIFDCSMVTISLVTCLLMIHRLGSVGVGTLIAAVLVGLELKLVTRLFGKARDKALHIDKTDEENTTSPLLEIMKKDVYTLAPETELKEALNFFIEKKISGAPVTDAEGNLKGFISDGDIMRYLSADHSLFVNANDIERIDLNTRLKTLSSKKVADVAVKHVITADASDDLDTVCGLLAEHHLKKVPVMKNGQMIGVINASNITKYAVSLMD